MPPRAKKEVAAPVEKDDSIPLMQFGAELFKQYEATSPPPSVTALQMARFGDYVHHFGFSLEREQAAMAGARVLPSLQARGAAPPRVRRHAQVSMTSSNEAMEEATWGMPEEERTAADDQCARVGPLREADPLVATVVGLICEPFQAVTWRQSRLQCARKRTRCLYLWLCQHVRVVLESELERAAAARAKALSADEGKKPKGKSSRAASPTKKRATTKKNSVSGAEADGLTEAESPPPDPLEEALRTRTATPHVLADLYSAMLHHAGVECEVVRGWVKGTACEETYDWYWNVVHIDGKQSLVDVASSAFTGPLRPPKGASSTGGGGGDGAGNGSTADGTSTTAVSKADASKKKRGAAAAGSPEGAAPSSMDGEGVAQQAAASPAADVALHRQVRFMTPRHAVEDFYFFCHPLQFIYTHLPLNDRHALLVQPPHRAVWTSAPRLTHDFFRFPVSLHSHQRSAFFTVRSTPFYVSVLNTAPASTELACKVYRGSLTDLPEHMREVDAVAAGASGAGAGASGANAKRGEAPSAAASSGARDDGTSPGAALSLDWIWQQRCESSQTETFTIMTPDVGYYSVVIGARAIRGDPYGATIATTSFVPLVRYQVKVNFVPVSAPLLPRQHLSPSVCRLLAPLCAQVQAGPCTVSVMPSCSNVAAVAVVARSTRQPPSALVLPAEPRPGAASGAASAKAAPAGAAQPSDDSAREEVTRDVLAFLPFSTASAAYSGTVSLSTGTTAELWVLYTAPDENGLTFHDRVQHRVAAAAAAAAPSTAASAAVAARDDTSRGALPPTKPRASKTKGRKNGAEAAAPPDEDPAVHQRAALAALLDQGRAFRPFVTGIEARKLITSDVKDLIQPQPTLEEEREPTLRRLIGVTDALYQEAGSMRDQEVQPVGGYLDARAPGTAKDRRKRA